MKTIKQQLIELALITALLIIVTGMILDGGMVMYPLLVGALTMWMTIGCIALIRLRTKTKVSDTEKRYLLLAILPFWLIAAILNSVLAQANWIPAYYILLGR